MSSSSTNGKSPGFDVSKRPVVIGTRKSRLALRQTEMVSAMLHSLHPGIRIETKHIVTQGDLSQGKDEPLPSIGGKGLFTAELEAALLSGSIDFAVHSFKDLPTKMEREFSIGAVCKRESVADVLISRTGALLQELPRLSLIHI